MAGHHVALILVNLLIFAGTHRLVDQQDSQLWKVEEHILILAATHPNLVLAPKAREFVDGFRASFQTIGPSCRSRILR